jgi:hypothetical protein
VATNAIATINLRNVDAAMPEGTPTTITSADTGTLPAVGRMVARVSPGATGGTLTVAANTADDWQPLVIPFTASTPFYLAIDDPAQFGQPDGLYHLTTTQTVTVVAIRRR